MSHYRNAIRTNPLCKISSDLAVFIALVAGCSQSYVTPGRGVPMASLANVDYDIAERMKVEPRATFPTRIAVVRVQGPDYRSYRCDGYGSGRYCVVTTRDMEKDDDWARMEKLKRVAGVAPLNRMVIPSSLQTDKEIRLAAASLKADILLAYTLDTTFRIDERDFGPMRLISLGMLPTKEAKITATASAALFDVRTGYVYGLAEATAQERRIASTWTSADVVDQSRQAAERKAFEQLIGEIERTWDKVLREYDSPGAQSARQPEKPAGT